MTRHYILISLVLLYNISQSQVIDNKIQIFIKEEKIDSFIIYSFPCVGGISLEDSCAQKGSYFLFWVHDTRHYFKQFKACIVSKEIMIDSDDPITYYITNKKQINREKIKPPTYYEYKKTRKGIDTIMLSSFVDHSCYHTFAFKVGPTIFEKSADEYNFDFVKFDNGRRNIFYNHNQLTLFKKLIDKTTRLIANLGTDKKIESQ